MKYLVLLLLQISISMGPPKSPIGGGGGGCTPPTLTYEWPVYNPANTCLGGGACANGNLNDTIVDLVAGNNATNSNPSLQPTYNTAQVNTKPADTWNTAAELPFPTPVAASGTTDTWFAVIKPTASTLAPIVGGSSGGFEWRISASGHQEVLLANTTLIGTGTAVISSSVYSTVAIEYDKTAGTWAFFICSGGTCTADGSGSGGITNFLAVTNILGLSSGDGGFVGSIAEIGYRNTLSITGIGAYSQSCYAI